MPQQGSSRPRPARRALRASLRLHKMPLLSPDVCAARAHRWKRLLEEGTYQSAVEIAGAESITRSFVNRLLRLALLAPDIREAILDGRQSKGMQIEDLTRAKPSGWEEQRRGILAQ